MDQATSYNFFYQSLSRPEKHSEVATFGDPEIQLRGNIAYAPVHHPPRGSLPSPPSAVCRNTAVVSQESVYEIIPGEELPSAQHSAYELINPRENQPLAATKPTEAAYEMVGLGQNS